MLSVQNLAKEKNGNYNSFNMEGNTAHIDDPIKNENVNVLEEAAKPEQSCQEESGSELQDMADKEANAPTEEKPQGSSSTVYDMEEEILSKLLFEINCDFKARLENRYQPACLVQPNATQTIRNSKAQPTKKMNSNENISLPAKRRKTSDNDDNSNCPLRTAMKRKLHLDRRMTDSKHRYQSGGRIITQKSEDDDKATTFGGIDAKTFMSYLQTNTETNTTLADKTRIVKMCHENPKKQIPETAMMMEARKRPFSSMDIAQPSEKIIKLSHPLYDDDVTGEMQSEEESVEKQEKK